MALTGVSSLASRARLQQFAELLDGQSRLAKDALEGPGRQIFVVDGKRNSEFRSVAVKETSGAAGLMINVKPSSRENLQAVLGLNDGVNWCHEIGNPVRGTRRGALWWARRLRG